MTKLSIIVPIYNERETINALLKSLDAIVIPDAEKEIILIDDGSNDGTTGMVKNFENQYKTLYHAQNLGKGAAISTALKRATGDYIIIQDADLEYNPQEIPKLLTVARGENLPAVYGSRNLGRTKRGYWAYFLGGKLITSIFNLLYGTKLTDINTGYKLFSRETLLALKLTATGFDFCEEVTARLARAGISIREIPISYKPRTFAEGKKIRFWDGIRGIWAVIRHRF